MAKNAILQNKNRANAIAKNYRRTLGAHGKRAFVRQNNATEPPKKLVAQVDIIKEIAYTQAKRPGAKRGFLPVHAAFPAPHRTPGLACLLNTSA